MKERKIIEVVAAVIIKDGNILCTQRGYGDFKGKWEFPGGKIEKGEKLEDALIREIKEETNADIEVEKFVKTFEYDYPEFHLIMHTFICTLLNDLEVVYHDDNNLEHENTIWLDYTDLHLLDWLPADIEVVEELQKIMSKKVSYR